MLDWTLPKLCAAAFAAGAVNSVAGGGTLLTFPALFAVLTAADSAGAAVIANATSTVALVPGSLAGAWGYRNQIAHARGWLTVLFVPSIIGGAIGSLLVTRLDPRYFSALVPWLILTATSLLLADTLIPRRRPTDLTAAVHSGRSVAGLVLFQFGVALYGGYFGAGIGILMLSSLAMMGIGDINRMNAVKTVLASCINGVSVGVFIYDRKVDWQYAIPMAIAAIAGGYAGARAALWVRPRYVRWIVIAIGFVLAAWYFSRR